MKKYLVFMLFLVTSTLCLAQPYTWGNAIISGDVKGSDDPETIIIPGFSHPYGVAVTENHHVWTASYYNRDHYDMTILVYDAQTESIDTIGPEITTPEGNKTLGYCRSFAKLGNGNIAYADWSNDRILIFDKETHDVVAVSDSCNVGGGIEAFVFNDEQYYLTQRIVGSEIVIWNSLFVPVDTLQGSPGGRNLAATENGDFIISPSLGKDYLAVFRGDPVSGYALDTLYLSDLGIDMENIMYVSSGPNDYIWLFSRDARHDGVYVIDPYLDPYTNNYNIKLSSYTDSSVTFINGFDLGMAVEDQYKIWLAQGSIDSSDVYTKGGYPQPWILRAPCQVASYFDGTCEYLYIADYYGYTLKHWLRYVCRPFTLSASSVNVVPGKNETITVYGTLPFEYSFTSFEIALYGFLPHTQLKTLYRYNNDWNITYHVSNDTLYVKGNGSTPIQGGFSLFKFEVYVPDTISTYHIPVYFGKVRFNDERYGIIKHYGEINVQYLDIYSGRIAHNFGDVVVHNDPDTNTYEFKIRNVGPNTLQDNITKSVNWISLSHYDYNLGPQDSLTVTVTATTTGLSAGNTYYGFIHVHIGDLYYLGKVEVNILEESATITDPVISYYLSDNFPNPFNPTTRIQYDLKENTKVNLSVFDIHGKKVAELINTVQGSGRYDLTWDASSLPSGLYIYQLTAGDFIDRKKCMLIK